MPNKHTLNSFDRDLQTLRSEVLAMGQQVDEEIQLAVNALVTADNAAAKAVVESDRAADALHNSINARMSVILTRQQAVADDLRSILAAGRIATHLERIGDYAKNTAKRSLRLTLRPDATMAAQFRWMGERIRGMLQRIMQAYRDDDAQLANVTWTTDAELDAMYARLFAYLLDEMKRNKAPLSDGVQLLFIAKGLERAGDHVTDIAEEVYLKVTGAPLQGQRPKVDEVAALKPERR